LAEFAKTTKQNYDTRVAGFAEFSLQKRCSFSILSQIEQKKRDLAEYDHECGILGETRSLIESLLTARSAGRSPFANLPLGGPKRESPLLDSPTPHAQTMHSTVCKSSNTLSKSLDVAPD
jgi:hypothetical protein